MATTLQDWQSGVSINLAVKVIRALYQQAKTMNASLVEIGRGYDESPRSRIDDAETVLDLVDGKISRVY